jgi:hypothetical protein
MAQGRTGVAERAAVLRQKLRSSVDSTDLICAYRDRDHQPDA